MSAYMTRGGAAVAALLLAWPAMAQQAPASDPHHPADAAATPGAPAQPAPSAAAPAAPRPGPGGGMGMMGMMGAGQGGMPMMMGGSDGRPGMGMMRHHGGDGSPMNVIINVGPGIRVDIDDEDGRRGMGRRGMMRDGMPGMMGGGMPMRDMPGGPGAGMGLGGPMAEQLHDLLAERFEGGLAFLRTELRIRPDQEAAWTKYTASMQPQSGPWSNPGEDMKKLSAPERAEKMLEWSKSRQERMGEHVAALKTFYATLTPEQKKTFDEHQAGPRGRGRGPGQGMPPPAK